MPLWPTPPKGKMSTAIENQQNLIQALDFENTVLMHERKAMGQDEFKTIKNQEHGDQEVEEDTE
jgi:hypothetical protein